MKSRFLYFAFAVFGLGIDQIVKELVRQNFVEHQSHPVIPNVFELTLTYNRGIAFGQFQGFGVSLAPVAVLIAGYGCYQVFKHPTQSPWPSIAWGLLSAGALGNLVDRLVFQQVTDMFWIRAIDFPVFNVADICITVAASMMILGWLQEALHQRKTGEPSTEDAPESL